MDEAVRRELAGAPPPPLAGLLRAASGAGVIVALALAIGAWSSLPDRVPAHFGPDGRVDGWGGRGTLLVLPGLALFLFGVLTLVARAPMVYNYPFPITRRNARRQATLAMAVIAWLRLAMVWMLAYLEWRVIAAARDPARGLGAWFLPVILAGVLGPLAFYFVAAWRAR